MKKNVFAIFLAVTLVAVLLCVVAPGVKAEDSDLIYLGEDGIVTITAENQNKILDLKGHKTATVKFEVSAELKVIDTSFMLANGDLDLTGDSAGVLTVVNAENVNGTVASVSQYGDYRYLAVSNAGTYSFHPFNMAISRRGINVVSKTVSLEAMFIANNVVREMITDFGVYKLDGDATGAFSAKKTFDKKNGVVAGYDLANSLDAEMLNVTRNFCAYIKIGDMLIKGNQKVEVTPAKVLDGVNKAYADGKYSGEEKALAVKLFNENADLQQYLQAMAIFAPGGNWDLTNQHNGVITLTEKGTGSVNISTVGSNYRDAAITVKDFAPSYNADGQGNFEMQIRFTFANGKYYQLRLHNTDKNSQSGKYKIQNMDGITKIGSASGWKWLVDLTTAQVNKLLTEGVQFRVALVDTYAVMLIDGVQMATYDLSSEFAAAGIAADAPAKIRFTLGGNNNQKDIEMPFVLGEEPAYAKVQTAGSIANGKVSTNKTITAWAQGKDYKTISDKAVVLAGQTVTLTSTPNSGYAQKLYINGQPLLLDYNTGKYSIVAEAGKTYEISGSFVPAVKWFSTADWNVSNQGHGLAYAPAHGLNAEGKQIEATGDLVPEKGSTSGMSVLVTDPSRGTQQNYAIVLKILFKDGRKAEVRLINEKADGKYRLQTLGNNVLGNWNTHYNLTDAENQAIMNGDGVWYGMTLNGATLCMRINDNVVKVVDLSANGITSLDQVDQVKLTAYNFGHAVEIPYIIHPLTIEKPPVEEDDVVLNIPTFANGSVVAKKASYKVGETVSLIITPTNGYSQKLYINGEPLMLDWKTSTYSFVAEEGKTYAITGSFEKSYNIAFSDANRWDSVNQAHGVLNTYYPNNNDSWFVDIKGEYKSIEVNAQNLWEIDKSYEGIANGGGFRIVLRMNLDNGKNYAFSIWIDTIKRYCYNHFGGGSSATGWGGAWCLVGDKNADAMAALNGAGAKFKLERIDGNHMQITLNGTVLETYTIPDVTEANKVVSVGIQHNGNKGEYLEIPFEVK